MKLGLNFDIVVQPRVACALLRRYLPLRPDLFECDSSSLLIN